MFWHRASVWFENRTEDLRTNFWFVPTVMVAAAIGLSLAMINLDKATAPADWIATLGWTFTRGPEGSRAVLSAVAGSMMTITSVTFSITVVALQLASSQFGPRLLRNFMRDRGNQVALGTFIATFAYCLLVLRTVNGTEGQEFVPHLSVTVGLLLALTSLGVLIYFIHHAAESIQADRVVASVGRELQESIDRLFPREGEPGGPGAVEALPDDFDARARPIPSPRSDYLQAIDVESLIALARDHDVVVRVPHRPGKFLIEGAAIALAWPAERADEALVGSIRDVFYFGGHRTLTQDVEFAVDQLVEVAVRALSPGINDPFTAISCVDRLGAGLGALAGRRLPSPSRLDEEGRLRVVVDVSRLPGIVDAAFNQIRQAARGDVAVSLRLLETLAAVAARSRDPELLAALRHHAEMVHRGALDAFPEPDDRAEAEIRFRSVLEAIEAGGVPS